MYLFEEESRELLQSLKKEFAGEVTSKIETLRKINTEEDWAFFIKLQSLIEVTITTLIVEAIGNQAINFVIKRLPLVDEQMGKLKIAKEFGLLGSSERRFIKLLATLRNRLAHEVSSDDFCFKKYLSGLTKNEQKNWRDTLLYFSKDKKDDWIHIYNVHPRVAVFMSGYMILVQLIFSTNDYRCTKQIDDLSKETSDALFALMDSTKKLTSEKLND